jgi:hypothetical protein
MNVKISNRRMLTVSLLFFILIAYTVSANFYRNAGEVQIPDGSGEDFDDKTGVEADTPEPVYCGVRPSFNCSGPCGSGCTNPSCGARTGGSCECGR